MTMGIGSRIADRYLLEELVGRGGMADVYRATDDQLGRQVAVKVLRGHAGSESERARFSAEARTVAGLNHPNVVTLLDAGLTEDQPYLIMELVEGPTLAAFLLDAPLEPAEVARIGVQVAEALDYAHRQGVVHRDVKPGNVLLGGDGRVFLADFGIARLADSATRHTSDGQTIGSPAYLSPEQLTADDVTGAADVYGLGLVLLEALTGERAFTGTGTEVAYARLQSSPQIPVSLGSPWTNLLARMTDLEPSARPTPDEVREALVAYAAGLGPVEPEAEEVLTAPMPRADQALATQKYGRTAPGDATETLTRPGEQPSRTGSAVLLHGRHLWLTLGAVLAVILLAALVTFWLSGDETSDHEPPTVPSDVPTRVQSPLDELHRAIHGGDA